MMRPDPRLPRTIRGPLNEIASALDQIRRPQAPLGLFNCTHAELPIAADWAGCLLRVSDLNTLAHSDGTRWVRVDTGGAV